MTLYIFSRFISTSTIFSPFLPFLLKVPNHGRSTTVVVKPLFQIFPVVANERVAPPPIEFGAFEKESTANVNTNSRFGYF